MKLRHVVVITAFLGACGALLLAGDMYRRVVEAENALLRPASAAKEGVSAPVADSILQFGMVHALGVLALAFLFLALFLFLIAALRERVYVAALEGQRPADPAVGSAGAEPAEPAVPEMPAAVSEMPAAPDVSAATASASADSTQLPESPGAPSMPPPAEPASSPGPKDNP